MPWHLHVPVQLAELNSRRQGHTGTPHTHYHQPDNNYCHGILCYPDVHCCFHLISDTRETRLETMGGVA